MRSEQMEIYSLVDSLLMKLLTKEVILSFKQKGYGVFLNYPYDFKS